MCGIFGIFSSGPGELAAADVHRVADDLFRLSESRGREAAGLALRSATSVSVLKRAVSASAFIRSAGYRKLFAGLETRHGFGLIGHSRLVTNGSELVHDNNQPVMKGGLVAVHNGIIVNDEALWRRHSELKRRFEIDTEVIVDLAAARLDAGSSLGDAVVSALSEVEGTVTVAILSDGDDAVLATNTGSLYIAHDDRQGLLVFASERFILDRLAGLHPRLKLAPSAIRQVRPGQGVVVERNGAALRPFSLTENAPRGGDRRVNHRLPVVDLDRWEDPAAAPLVRCTRCILPETMPFIQFDQQGVCNYCRDHVERPLRDPRELEGILAAARRGDGSPDCIVAISGGRDSCYGLHLLKTRFKMNPIAYSYDWGMVTDLGRRNQARLCGKLGVEHVLVSADIRRKRANIRMNIEAWLRRPILGLVPLFMAGDKQYFYHAHMLRRRTGIDLVFMLENQRYEKTGFKSGFCGVDEGRARIYDVSLADKARLAAFYGGQFIANPRYLNRSLLDTAGAFLSSYALKHDFVPLYDFVHWDETEVVGTLTRDYNWELAADTKSTWRIGDGTAAFYNYIYYTMAGFTEHDTFRSHQIRAGAIARDEALRRVREDNAPRWRSMEWYARIIGFDLAEAVRVINSAPRLYAAG